MDLHNLLHILPSVIACVLFIGTVLFFLVKRFVKQVDVGQTKLIEKVEYLSKRIDSMSTSITESLADKVSWDEYKQGLSRVFTRIDEAEATNNELSRRLSDIEWIVGVRKRPVREDSFSEDMKSAE